jgi:hypothetical protein
MESNTGAFVKTNAYVCALLLTALIPATAHAVELPKITFSGTFSSTLDEGAWDSEFGDLNDWLGKSYTLEFILDTRGVQDAYQEVASDIPDHVDNIWQFDSVYHNLTVGGISLSSGIQPIFHKLVTGDNFFIPENFTDLPPGLSAGRTYDFLGIGTSASLGCYGPCTHTDGELYKNLWIEGNAYWDVLTVITGSQLPDLAGDPLNFDGTTFSDVYISFETYDLIEGTRVLAVLVGQVDAIGVTSVQLLPVPEPESYAMLLAGLGLVGWAAKRRAV